MKVIRGRVKGLISIVELVNQMDEEDKWKILREINRQIDEFPDKTLNAMATELIQAHEYEVVDKYA